MKYFYVRQKVSAKKSVAVQILDTRTEAKRDTSFYPIFTREDKQYLYHFVFSFKLDPWLVFLLHNFEGAP